MPCPAPLLVKPGLSKIVIDEPVHIRQLQLNKNDELIVLTTDE